MNTYQSLPLIWTPAQLTNQARCETALHPAQITGQVVTQGTLHVAPVKPTAHFDSADVLAISLTLAVLYGLIALVIKLRK